MSDIAPPLSVADQSFLLALRCWGGDVDSRLWDGFSPEWREALQRGWSHNARDQGQHSPLERLRREHLAQSRPDLSRVDPSWWLRGLKEETASVRRAVVASASGDRRETLRAGLGLSHAALATDFTPHPEALRWVSVLWAERLVGDLPQRADDSRAISLLTQLRMPTSLRLIRAVGLAKWAASRAAPPWLSLRAYAQFRVFREQLAAGGERLQDYADRDVAALRGNTRHARGRLGTLTVARLLSLADPYRVRWALQHIPYRAAKLVRSLMPARGRGNASWVSWESRVLHLAWERLDHPGPLLHEAPEGLP